MDTLAFLIVLYFIAFCVYIGVRLFTDEYELVMLWLGLGVAIIAVCIIPLIVYICQGNFAGMTVAEAIFTLVDMVFSGEAGMASNLIKGLCFLGLPAFAFHMCVLIDKHKKK